jgi:hypothetical protein
MNASIRRHYVLSLRDELPLGKDGWSVIVHHSDCPRRDEGGVEVLTCSLATCLGVVCRFFQIAGENDILVQATRDLLEGAERLGCEPNTDGDFDGPSLSVFRTVIAVSAPYRRGDSTADHFGQCLRVVYEAGKALRIATSAAVPHITTERFWPFYLIAEEESPGEPEVQNIVLVHSGQLPGGPTATPEQLEMAELFFGAGWNGDPVEIYRDFKLSAQLGSSATGDYVQAILSAATAAEVLTKNTAWMLTWEATTQLPHDPGSAPNDSNTLSGRPSQLIGGVLARRLGGNWDSKSTASPVGAWRQYIARRRNAIIHRGWRPLGDEVTEAVEALINFEKHVLDRLASKAALYPRTSIMLLGENALKRRGVWNRVRDVAAAENSQVWLADYRGWLSTIAAALDEE